MQIKLLHEKAKLPRRSTDSAAGYDIFMPEDGIITHTPTLVNLGFASAIPGGFFGLLVPRSGVGAKEGVELNNTCGIIDSDYRGEWKAVLKTKLDNTYKYNAGDRVLQVLILPVMYFNLEVVETLPEAYRDSAGFGSSGK